MGLRAVNGSRNQRGITPERVVLAATLRALKKRPDLCHVMRMNVGAFRIGSRFVRFGQPGMPDIMCVACGGRSVWIECKSSVGRLSEAQEAFRVKVEKMGALYFLVAGSGDIENMLKCLDAIEAP